MTRPTKKEYYLNISKAVGKRSPCLRRKFGAIIIKEDAIVSTGYNGPPRGSSNCNKCLKDEMNAPKWERYDLCPAVHAEENAIVNAARNGTQVKDGTLFVIGKDVKKNRYTESHPCNRCKRAIINAGIKTVVTQNDEGKIMEYTVKNWAKKDKIEYEKALKEASKKKNRK